MSVCIDIDEVPVVFYWFCVPIYSFIALFLFLGVDVHLIVLVDSVWSL